MSRRRYLPVSQPAQAYRIQGTEGDTHHWQQPLRLLPLSRLQPLLQLLQLSQL